MSIKKIHLNKLLKAFALPENQLTTLLRADIRNEISKKTGSTTGGGDFYIPFWSDAKNHVAGDRDLHDATEARIKANSRRKNLYPFLKRVFWNGGTISVGG